MIHYVPLEPVESRYTKYLHHAILSSLKRIDTWYCYQPDYDEEPLPKGQFLDAAKTCFFKSEQLALITRQWNKQVEDGDTFFFSDLWFPGLEMLGYLQYFTKRKVKIKGLLHAGSWTDTDFVRDMERWASLCENAWFDLVDEIFVGSQFFKDDLLKKRLISPEKIVVTGFPLDRSLLLFHRNQKYTKEKRIVFNGRLCDEKQPWLCSELQHALKAPVIKTMEANMSKNEYYEYTAKSKVTVSFALQENFGFGMLEAAAVGSVPIVPDRLSYRELFPEQYRYRTWDECVKKVRAALNDEIPPMEPKLFEDAPKRWFR